MGSFTDLPKLLEIGVGAVCDGVKNLRDKFGAESPLDLGSG